MLPGCNSGRWTYLRQIPAELAVSARQQFRSEKNASKKSNQKVACYASSARCTFVGPRLESTSSSGPPPAGGTATEKPNALPPELIRLIQSAVARSQAGTGRPMSARGIWTWLRPDEAAQLPMAMPGPRALACLLARAAGEFEGLRLERFCRGAGGHVYRLVRVKVAP